MKVLIAVDGSNTAEHAFEWYFTNVHKLGNTVVVAHAGEPPQIPSLSFTEGAVFPSDEISHIIQRDLKKKEELKNKFAVRCSEENLRSKLSFETYDGNPGEAIVEISHREECNIIIIGSRGLGAIRRTILGSVSDYVLHHAKVPVLIVPKHH